MVVGTLADGGRRHRQGTRNPEFLTSARWRRDSHGTPRHRHTPVAIDNLCHAEVDRNGHQRDSFIFGETLGRHQNAARFDERVAHCEV
jgi:hypothetical protein